MNVGNSLVNVGNRSCAVTGYVGSPVPISILLGARVLLGNMGPLMEG